MVRQAPQRAVDLLTGMPDRRAFDAALEVAVLRAVRHQTPLSVVLLDVDGFGALNEADGHENGDRVLVRLAADLDAALRAEPRHGRGALLARLGGDDFAVVVPDCDGAAAQELARRLVAAAAPLSICAGTALREPGEEAAPLQRRAAAALSRAKSMGRGLVEHSPATDRELVRDLVDAIASDRLQVVLQPVVDPADGQLMGVEALARWHHPRRGAVPPDVFVHLAETHGLVVEMGRALLRRAIAEATSLRDAVGRDLLLTVNASGLELVHPDFVPQVVEVLAATHWSPRHLVVEVTESLVEADSPEAREALEDLRWCGIGVAIDDFGTGYSSLSRMDELPADYLKLDSGFIAEISESPRRRALLRGLVAMSREIGLVVIAEGIETSDQALLVSEVGCPLAQGFHFHRPAPAADLVRRFQAPTLAPAAAPDTARADAGTGTA
nr:bifunctional diguanylate cyclase/phosphodiesterase [Quadrisphaera sp. RL12-1S]